MHAETTMAITTNQRVFRATQQNPQSRLESGVTMPLVAERTNDINDHSLQAKAGFATSHLLMQLVCQARVYSHSATKV